MPDYSGIQKEETFKAAVFRDFFSNAKYAYEPNIDNIDFIVTETKTLKGNIWTRHYLWAESKKGVAEIYSMLTQLVLTVKKLMKKGSIYRRLISLVLILKKSPLYRFTKYYQYSAIVMLIGTLRRAIIIHLILKKQKLK